MVAESQLLEQTYTRIKSEQHTVEERTVGHERVDGAITANAQVAQSSFEVGLILVREDGRVGFERGGEDHGRVDLGHGESE